MHGNGKSRWVWSKYPCATNRHDDVIKWKHFPRYWPFVRGIHRSPVNSPHKGQWRGAVMFSLICTWINSWVNNPEAGELRRHRAHCDVSVMRAASVGHMDKEGWLDVFYSGIFWPTSRNASWDIGKRTIVPHFTGRRITYPAAVNVDPR